MPQLIRSVVYLNLKSCIGETVLGLLRKLYDRSNSRQRRNSTDRARKAANYCSYHRKVSPVRMLSLPCKKLLNWRSHSYPYDNFSNRGDNAWRNQLPYGDYNLHKMLSRRALCISTHGLAHSITKFWWLCWKWLRISPILRDRSWDPLHSRHQDLSLIHLLGCADMVS